MVKIILSIFEIIIAENNTKPIPAAYCPVNNKYNDAGTHSIGVPNIGKNDKIAPNIPHKTGLRIPTIQKLNPISNPWIIAITPVLTTVELVIFENLSISFLELLFENGINSYNFFFHNSRSISM